MRPQGHWATAAAFSRGPPAPAAAAGRRETHTTLCLSRLCCADDGDTRRVITSVPARERDALTSCPRPRSKELSPAVRGPAGASVGPPGTQAAGCEAGGPSSCSPRALEASVGCSSLTDGSCLGGARVCGCGVCRSQPVLRSPDTQRWWHSSAPLLPSCSHPSHQDRNPNNTPQNLGLILGFPPAPQGPTGPRPPSELRQPGRRPPGCSPGSSAMTPRGPGSLPAGHRRSASSSRPESPEGEGAPGHQALEGVEPQTRASALGGGEIRRNRLRRQDPGRPGD